MKTTALKQRATEIVARLAQKYPNPKTALNHNNPFELLIATVMSAQSTDKRVNIVTAQFFPTHDTPEKLLSLGLPTFQKLIQTVGLYQTKSKNIFALCQILIDKHSSQVPNNRDDLEALPGVGRKTANVVLSNAFGIPAFAVDTHVFRVTHRLGLTKGKNPEQVEQDIMKLLPEQIWTNAHHYFIFHGRETCKAIKPQCAECILVDLCPSKQLYIKSEVKRAKDKGLMNK